jgi:hypothetical protein
MGIIINNQGIWKSEKAERQKILHKKDSSKNIIQGLVFSVSFKKKSFVMVWITITSDFLVLGIYQFCKSIAASFTRHLYWLRLDKYRKQATPFTLKIINRNKIFPFELLSFYKMEKKRHAYYYKTLIISTLTLWHNIGNIINNQGIWKSEKAERQKILHKKDSSKNII